MAKMVYTSIYEYIRAYTMPYDIIPYPRLSILYDPIWIISDHIGGIYIVYAFVESINVYIQVYGISRYMTVYDCLWRYMMFQDSIYKYIPSWTVYTLVCWRYIKVYSSIYILIIWPIDSFPAAPARLARLKAANLPLPLVHTRHTQVQAQLCLLFASFASFARPPGPLGRDWHRSGGSGRVRCPPGTARKGSFALQQSM